MITKKNMIIKLEPKNDTKKIYSTSIFFLYS